MAAEQKTKLTPASDSLTLKDAMETIWYKGVIKIYPVTDSKLEELTAGYNSLYLVFCGIFIGAGFSFLIACNDTLVASEKPYYLAVCIATFGLGIFFAIHGITNYVRAWRAKRDLYENSIPLEPRG